MTARRLAHRLLACLRRRRLDADLESEILAHLELAEREAVARGLSPQDARGAPRVIVLGHAAWRDRFGGAADILDRELVVDGEAHRIVGVLPPWSLDREPAASRWVLERVEASGDVAWRASRPTRRRGRAITRVRTDSICTPASASPRTIETVSSDAVDTCSNRPWPRTGSA